MSNLRIDNIAPSAGGTYRNAPRGIAAAWVNFNGTGTPAITDSQNVGSITDNGTGDYTINLSSAFATANYSLTGIAGNTTNDDGYCVLTAQLVGSFTSRIRTHIGTLNDAHIVCFNTHGDLA